MLADHNELWTTHTISAEHVKSKNKAKPGAPWCHQQATVAQPRRGSGVKHSYLEGPVTLATPGLTCERKGLGKGSKVGRAGHVGR